MEIKKFKKMWCATCKHRKNCDAKYEARTRREDGVVINGARLINGKQSLEYCLNYHYDDRFWILSSFLGTPQKDSEGKIFAFRNKSDAREELRQLQMALERNGYSGFSDSLYVVEKSTEFYHEDDQLHWWGDAEKRKYWRDERKEGDY